MTATLRLGPDAPCRRLAGVGGIGGGMFLALEGERTLGRNESRGARLLDARDACKLHIVAHHVAVLLGARPTGSPFHVVPIATVGTDDLGRRVTAEMANVGMDLRLVQAVDRPTLFSVCFLYPDGSGGNLTTVDSAAAALRAEDVDRAEPLLAETGGRTIVLAAPEVGLDVRRRILELGTEHGAFRVASFTSEELSAARSSGMLGLVDLVSLNEDEGATLVGSERDPEDQTSFLEAIARVLATENAAVRILLTAGVVGAFAFEDGRWVHRGPVPVPVQGTAGAGDALLGGVIAALAAGVPLLDPSGDDEGRALTCALDLGVLLAAYSVTSPHTIHPSADLGSLVTFAAEVGLAFAPPLADVV